MKKPSTGIQLERGLAVIESNDLVRCIKREMPSVADNVVGYYVPHNGRYCVGVWLHKSRGQVREGYSYRHNSELTRTSLRFIRWSLSDARRKDSLRYKKKLQTHRRGWRVDANDRRDEDRARYFTPRKAQLVT